MPLDSVWPSPENDRLYRPVDPADPEIIALASTIREEGVLEPLVVTEDHYILSGHRRRAAAELAGLTTVPCRVLSFSRCDDADRFLRLLRRFNQQRVKTRDERLREVLLDVNPDDEYAALIDHRRAQASPAVAPLEIVGTKHRAEISDAKRPMLDAVIEVLEGLRNHWPLSDRQVHYQLLNNPPLRHAGKPGSTYANDLRSYKDLTDLVTRARIAGVIPWEAIGDETRPVTNWDVWREPGGYIRREVDEFLKGYWRDLMQSQPHHVEIVAEKNTVRPILEPVAMRYTIPLTTGRGYCSSPPRYEMAQRYRRSGKNKLVVLMLVDFDPDGQEIAHSFARSLRDDFGVTGIHPIKVAIDAEHVARYRLPAKQEAKATSSQYAKFTKKHGKTVYELEALSPANLQRELTDALDKVIDVEAFNAELSAEKADAAFLAGVRRTAADAMAGIDFTREGGE